MSAEPLRLCVVGATGWVGRELVAAIVPAADLALVAAVARRAAGQDLGAALGRETLGIVVSERIEDALRVPADVVVDYTKPDAVKSHVLAAVAAGCGVVIGTSGLAAEDFAEIDQAARSKRVGVIAAGNFSLTATLMQRFAMMAAPFVADCEIVDYAGERKPDVPSGTARELAERLGELRKPGAATALPVGQLRGPQATRGAEVGGIQVHSLRLPGFVLSCEVLFGMPGERLAIRHDAGSSAAPYVAGTLLAIRKVTGRVGLTRGLDSLMFA